jgi:ankyrin repeat protein
MGDGTQSSVSGFKPAAALWDGEDEVDPADEARLWEAVHEGDQDVLHELLVGDDECPTCGLSVNCKDAAGMTPLHWLTVDGHTSVAQWFIDEVGAQVDEPDARYGQSALHFAAAKGKATVTGLLLHRGADPVRRDTMGWTPLHAAARAGNVDVMAALLGALTPDQIDLAGPCGCTALHRAAFWGQAEVRLPTSHMSAPHPKTRAHARTPLALADGARERGWRGDTISVH